MNKKKFYTYMVILIPVIAFILTAFSPLLYDVFCRVTGYGGTFINKANDDVLSFSSSPGTSCSFYTVNLKTAVYDIDSRKNDDNFDFESSIPSLSMCPGKIYTVEFNLENKTPETRDIRIIYHNSLPIFSQYLKKIQCFCFDSMTIFPYEKRNFNLIFFLNDKIRNDKNINNIHNDFIIYYSLFDITGKKV